MAEWNFTLKEMKRKMVLIFLKISNDMITSVAIQIAMKTNT